MTAARHYGTPKSVDARFETDLTRAVALLTDHIADGDAPTRHRALVLLDWLAFGALCGLEVA